MESQLKKVIEKKIRIRWLASNERAGRFSRDQAWRQIEAYVGTRKLPYLGMAATPLIGSVTMGFFLHGAGRWLMIGVMGISGFWFALLQVILRSGAASNVMGTDGEVSTAEEIRRFHRRGWRLINDVKIHPTFGIDHVVVGPSGVHIVETKWSRDIWPINGDYDKYMSPRLSKAIMQVDMNRQSFLSQFGAHLSGVPVNALCVLWSASYPVDGTESIKDGQVEIVIGPALTSWMKSQDKNVLKNEDIDRIWKAIDELVDQRDTEARERGEIPRPTLLAAFVDSLLTPLVDIAEGVFTALFGLIVIGHYRPSWLLGGAVLFTVIGVLIRRMNSRKIYALGWLGTSLTFCFAFLGTWIQHLFTR